jgi:hypothetical protein
VRLINFVSSVFRLLLSICFSVQISQLYKSNGIPQMLHNFNRDCLWTKCSKTLFRIPKICKNLLPFVDMSISFPCEILYLKYVDVFA